MKRQTIILSFLILAIFQSGFSQTDQIERISFPKQIGCVNDYEGLFSEQEIIELTDTITDFEKKTSNKIIIVTANTYRPFETLMEYTSELANYWGIGQNGRNEGVIIVFGKSNNKIQIQISQKLENKLNEKEINLIIDNVILPEFKKGNYFAGIKNGIVEIMKKIE